MVINAEVLLPQYNEFNLAKVKGVSKDPNGKHISTFDTN